MNETRPWEPAPVGADVGGEPRNKSHTHSKYLFSFYIIYITIVDIDRNMDYDIERKIYLVICLNDGMD